MLLPRLAADPSGMNHGCVWGVTDDDPIRSLPVITFKKQVLREDDRREKPLFVFAKAGSQSCLERCPSVPQRPTWTPTG